MSQARHRRGDSTAAATASAVLNPQDPLPRTRAEAKALAAARAAGRHTPGPAPAARRLDVDTRAGRRAAAQQAARGRHASIAARPSTPPAFETRAARRAAMQRSGPSAKARPAVVIVAALGVLTTAQLLGGSGGSAQASPATMALVTTAPGGESPSRSGNRVSVPSAAADPAVATAEDSAEKAQVVAETQQAQAEDLAAARAAAQAQAAADAAAALAEARRLAAPVDAPINSGFGYRPNPFGGGPSMHSGVDYTVPCGVEVHAAAAGSVVEAGWMGGYGWRVVVEHEPREGRTIRTTYNHLQRRDVQVGAAVAKGALLGAVGTTGSSTGCHLHFEVQFDGTLVDPVPYL